ncbi:MAG: aminofutalosine synthase MqnE, partial [Thermodesulfobacteriota bacterium]
HNFGIKTNCTMLYGHIETIEERLDHFIYLRELQDRTNGFTAFIPLAFHSENTKLSHIKETTAVDDLKTIIVSRLMLDNIDHIKAYWVMLGEKLAQTALHFGADDLDGTILKEKITHSAGAKSAVGHAKETMIRLIKNAGMDPVERDAFYNRVKEN